MTSAYGGDVPSIKVEGTSAANGQGSAIKSESDTGASFPSAQADEDIYEDTGDLDFSGADQNVFLTRLPKFLWETWSKLDEDQEIELGTVRIEGTQSDVKRMSMMLFPDVAKKRNVPKEYNLHVMNQESINTFVFSEKDLPGFRFRQKDWSLNDTPIGRMSRVKKNKSKAHEFRRTIPKHTSLAGQVRTELNCLPVENAEYQRIMEERTRLALRPRREIQFVGGVTAAGGGNILNPGTLGANADLKSFINKAGPPRGKKTMLKAARMPQNELLDFIYECFKEYTYWPLRSLKERLNQPEAYLRQTLEMVAVMLRSGPHAMQWQLKPESREGRYADAGLFDQAKDEAAPDVGPSGDLEEGGEMEEDDENVDMEDVPLE